MKSIMKAAPKSKSVVPDSVRNRVKVFVATYTNEDLKIQMIVGPLKFERSKRGGDYTSRKIPVATI